MENQITILTVMRIILLWVSPFVLLEGVLLLIMKPDVHIKLEQHLGKEIGGIKKRLIPTIETNIYTFQNWLVKRTFVVGLFFIIYSAMLLIVLIK